jgi:hypothetical protein
VDPLAIVLVLVAIVLTAWVVGAPLRAGRAAEETHEHESELADLEAAKEARYREIREAEMDYRTGKLSEVDWRTIDRELRAEAVQILRQLDELSAGPPAAEPVRKAEAETAAEPVGRPPVA